MSHNQISSYDVAEEDNSQVLPPSSHAPTVPDESEALQYAVPQRYTAAKKRTRNNNAVVPKKKWTNSHSFSKRPNTLHKKWDEQETRLFYKLLQTLGTDFTTIQQFLKSKTVAQIKNKFNKEERENSEKIAQLLHNPGRNRTKTNARLDADNLERLRLLLANKFIKKQSLNLENGEIE
jgi:hypothetical protein